jgi:rhodanese-related sulfurtransferase
VQRGRERSVLLMFLVAARQVKVSNSLPLGRFVACLRSRSWPFPAAQVNAQVNCLGIHLDNNRSLHFSTIGAKFGFDREVATTNILCALSFHRNLRFYTTTTATSMMMPDYATRAKDYDFATRDEIQAVLQSATTSADGPPVILMDVRTDVEIQTDGRIHPLPNAATSMTWVHVTDCTPDDCPSLRETPQMYGLEAAEGGTNDTKPPTVVVYCKSGRRAHTARNVLRTHEKYSGYTILNAGGYVDIADLFE